MIAICWRSICHHDGEPTMFWLWYSDVITPSFPYSYLKTALLLGVPVVGFPYDICCNSKRNKISSIRKYIPIRLCLLLHTVDHQKRFLYNLKSNDFRHQVAELKTKECSKFEKNSKNNSNQIMRKWLIFILTTSAEISF